MESPAKNQRSRLPVGCLVLGCIWPFLAGGVGLLLSRLIVITQSGRSQTLMEFRPTATCLTILGIAIVPALLMVAIGRVYFRRR